VVSGLAFLDRRFVSWRMLAGPWSHASALLCLGELPMETVAGPTSTWLKPLAPAWLIDAAATHVIIGVLTLMVVGLLLSGTLMRQLKETRDWVFHTREVQSKIDEVAWDVLALQIGLRGFILTGDEAQLALRDRARAELLPDLNDLAALTRGDAISQEEVRSLHSLAQERLARVDALIAVRRRDGLEPARTLAAVDSDAFLTTAIAQLRHEEDRILQSHLAREREKAWLVFGALGLSAALAIGLTALAAVLLNRTLAVREAVLAEQKSLLGQKDLMMREIDHRVRNSLTLIYTLLTLHRRQAADNPDLALHLDDAAHRVLTVAKVHESLYRSEMPDRVDIGGYIRELCRDLAGSLAQGNAAFVRVQAAPVTVPGEKAILVGLIVAELVTNALKYADVSATAPITVTLDQSADEIRLSVADQGPGLPQDFQPGASNGLGMQVVLMLLRQLEGNLDVDRRRPGTKFVVTIPAHSIVFRP
jgi:two-component sensor histidine kinase